MKNGITGLFNRTLDSLSRFANEVFPPQYVCGHCLLALAKFDGSQRFCPHCKLPLY